MKTLFIINPAAGNGNAMKKWRTFKKTLDFPFEAKITEYAGHAIRIVKSLQQSEDSYLVIGFGGDGTQREITIGAAGAKNLVVGSVAAGSGNDFGRGFQSFKDGPAISDFLKSPKSSVEDLGEFSNGEMHQFVSSSGIGFDAEICEVVNRSRLKKYLNRISAGKLVYLMYVVLTLIRFQKFDLTVHLNGEEKEFRDVWFATIHNQPYFGGGMKISPHSKTDDGLLELTVVHGISRLKLLLVFGTVFSGTHTRFKEVAQFSAKEIFAATPHHSVHRHVDGDAIAKTDLAETVTYAVSASKWQVIQ
ncbi:diacylglycerol/lipid kinase family protein [Planococcus ruber]|uniref:diacylglycerol/lipid kinase family protein n=1 Tax=Planococcus ruber TaxID=2027871 RepID=UPI001FEE9308|nr:diacylglycerol kinase family protein [Planococcus ruber]MCJ1908525.1 diacylglycerol kinase family lipid kinase [Planococcus ruber]